jgi:hypothetical protein
VHAAVPGSWEQLERFEGAVSVDREGLWLRWAKGTGPNPNFKQGRLLRAQVVSGTCWVGVELIP